MSLRCELPMPDAPARARALRLARAAEHYRRILASVDALRAAAGGKLSEELEAEWAERAHDAFEDLDLSEQAFWCRSWAEFRGDLLAVLRARVGSLMGPLPPKPKHGPLCEKWKAGGCAGCNAIENWRDVQVWPRHVIQTLNLEHVRNLQTLQSIQWARTRDRKWGEAEQVGKRSRGAGRARVRSGSKLPRGAR